MKFKSTVPNGKTLKKINSPTLQGKMILTILK